MIWLFKATPEKIPLVKAARSYFDDIAAHPHASMILFLGVRG